MKTLQEIITVENKVAEMIGELISQLASDTREAQIDGVRPIGKNAVVVNVSQINAGILDPSYYIQSKQADVVEQKLRTARTATEFMDRLKEMVESKYVKIGSDKVRLNDKTVRILETYMEQR